jgi:hypothetical protein
MLSWWVGQMCARTSSSMRRPARRRGGDGEAVVLGGPGDDRVGGQGQAPHLLGLLLVVPAPDGTLAGVGESAAEGVQVLALVELPGD